MKTLVNDKTKEERLGIVKFLKDQEVTVFFECKPIVKGYFKKRGISPEKIFFKENNDFIGKIKEVSQDETLKILHQQTKEEIVLPMEYIESISLC